VKKGHVASTLGGPTALLQRENVIEGKRERRFFLAKRSSPISNRKKKSKFSYV